MTFTSETSMSEKSVKPSNRDKISYLAFCLGSLINIYPEPSSRYELKNEKISDDQALSKDWFALTRDFQTSLRTYLQSLPLSREKVIPTLRRDSSWKCLDRYDGLEPNNEYDEDWFKITAGTVFHSDELKAARNRYLQEIRHSREKWWGKESTKLVDPEQLIKEAEEMLDKLEQQLSESRNEISKLQFHRGYEAGKTKRLENDETDEWGVYESRIKRKIEEPNSGRPQNRRGKHPLKRGKSKPFSKNQNHGTKSREEGVRRPNDPERR